MKWESLSKKARDAMKELGNFGPTVNPADRLVKGWNYDDACGTTVKTYYTSADLRRIAAACDEAAYWLDKRAYDAEQAQHLTNLEMRCNICATCGMTSA